MMYELPKKMPEKDAEGRDYGINGPMIDGELLTTRAFDALPEGSIVEIVWEGGDGPGRYKKRTGVRGKREVEGYFESQTEPHPEYGWHFLGSTLGFLGARPQTQVKLVELGPKVSLPKRAWPGVQVALVALALFGVLFLIFVLLPMWTRY